MKVYINCANAEESDHGVTQDESALFYPFDGCVVVAMGKYRENSIAFHLTEGDTPDYGTVVASSPEIPLFFGDRVYVHPAHGKHMKGVRVNGRVIPSEVRMYGRAAVVGGKATKIEWWKSIMAKEDDGQPKATWDNVIIDRGDVIKETEGGILLTESSTYRPSKGVVVSIGEMAKRRHPDLREGSVVYYLANCMIPMRGLKVGEKYVNWGVVPSDGILCEVLEG